MDHDSFSTASCSEGDDDEQPREAAQAWLRSWASMFGPAMSLAECRAVVRELFVPGQGSVRFEDELGRAAAVPYDVLPRFLHRRWRASGGLLSERLEIMGRLACGRRRKEDGEGCSVHCRGEVEWASAYAGGGTVRRAGTLWASFASSGHAVAVHFRLAAAGVGGSPPCGPPLFLGHAAERFARVADAVRRTAYPREG